MPEGFWETREIAKEEGVSGLARSFDWGAKFRAVGQRNEDYVYEAGRRVYRPKEPSYTGYITFRQEFGGDVESYEGEGDFEATEAITAPQVEFRQGQSWITWFSGGGEDKGRYRQPDVLREIKITYWLRNDEQADIGVIRRWLDEACREALYGGTPLAEIESFWNGANAHYEVYEAATGRVAPMISDFEHNEVSWKYYNRKTGSRLRAGRFRK